MPISTIQQPLNFSGICSHVRSWVIPSPSLVPVKRATSPAEVKPSKLTVSARNTRLHTVKVVSPPDTPHGFPDEGAVQWKGSAILLEQHHIKAVPEHRQLSGCRLPHAFRFQTDVNPPFRARGRKPSRAVDWCSPSLIFPRLTVLFFSISIDVFVPSPHLIWIQDNIFRRSHSKRLLLLFTVHVDVFLFLHYVSSSYPATFLFIPAHDAIWIPPLYWLLLPLQKRQALHSTPLYHLLLYSIASHLDHSIACTSHCITVFTIISILYIPFLSLEGQGSHHFQVVEHLPTT